MPGLVATFFGGFFFKLKKSYFFINAPPTLLSGRAIKKITFFAASLKDRTSKLQLFHTQYPNQTESDPQYFLNEICVNRILKKG